jgi:hypothetical protein
MVRGQLVPGSEPPMVRGQPVAGQRDTKRQPVLGVGQILAWLANQLGERGGRLERVSQVPELLTPLARVAN